MQTSRDTEMLIKNMQDIVSLQNRTLQEQHPISILNLDESNKYLKWIYKK